MELHRLLAEDDAVSPVIGVVLVVAITVVLAAVAGTLLFGVADRPAGPVPTAQFSFDMNDGGDGWDNDNDYVNVTHEGGDTLDVETVSVKVGGDAVAVSASNWAEDVSAGDRLSLTDAAGPPPGSVAVGGGIEEGEAVRVIWDSPGSAETFVVASGEVN